MNKFLITNFYFDNRYSINTYKRVDSAIFDNHKLVALFEVKKPSNIVEMVSFTDINMESI